MADRPTPAKQATTTARVVARKQERRRAAPMAAIEPDSAAPSREVLDRRQASTRPGRKDYGPPLAGPELEEQPEPAQPGQPGYRRRAGATPTVSTQPTEPT